VIRKLVSRLTIGSMAGRSVSRLGIKPAYD